MGDKLEINRTKEFVVKSGRTLNKVNPILLYAIFLFLPLNLFLNNLFLTLFMVVFGIQTILSLDKDAHKVLGNKWLFLLVLNIPVVLLLIGMLYSSEPYKAFKDLGRLVPIAFMTTYMILNPAFFSKNIKNGLKALVVGCVVAALICWGIAIIEILDVGGALLLLISKEYAYHNLSETIDIHTPYLALFFNIAIGFCIFSLHETKRRISKFGLFFIALLLTLFLFNLMARNAIFCFIIFGIIYLLKQRKYLWLLGFVVTLIMISAYTFATEKNFLRDRFFKSVNIFENETIFSKKDGRFDRLAASYAVFKKFPLFGPGAASEDRHRKEIFYKNRDSEAFNDNYNAHNQFMEYLSTYGLLGGVSFIVLFSVLFKLARKQASNFLYYVLGCFFIANLSESMLERSWGIVFYVIAVMLILSWNEELTLKKRIHV